MIDSGGWGGLIGAALSLGALLAAIFVSEHWPRDPGAMA